MRHALRWLPIASLVAIAAISTAQRNNDPLARLAEQQAKNLLAQSRGLKQSPSRVLVRFKPGTSWETRRAARAQANAVALEAFRAIPGLEVIDSGLGAPQAITLLRKNPNVLYADADHIVKPTMVPNDPKISNQWGLGGAANHGLNAFAAWDVTTGDPNFVVADIDTGMQMDQVELVPNLYHNPNEIPGNGIDDDNNGFVDDVSGYDFYENDADPTDTHGHGTHTAGIIGAAGNNGLGLAGVAWRCKLMPIRFMGPDGGYESDAIRSINYAVMMGVRVSNNSWGGDAWSQAMQDTLEAAKNAGHLFVAAAGNSSADNNLNPMYPASYPNDNIISVAALDSTGMLAYFSNFGSTTVDIAAPGDNIYSTYLGNTMTYFSGTSMAAPQVTGVAVLVWSVHPDWTWQQVKNRILSRARATTELSGKCVTGGELDAYAALSDQPLPPSVAINSPGNSSVFTQGTPIVLSGSASDGVDGNIGGSIAWTSDRQGSLGTGASLSVTNLIPGFHKLTAQVVDSRGLIATNSVTITVRNTSPTVSVSSPNNGAAYSVGTRVTFTGTASDPQDGDMTSAIEWTSSLQGLIGTGGTFSRTDLVAGTHTITARVVDSGNLVATNTFSLSIVPSGGTAPTISVSGPATAAVGASVTLTGTATDAQDGNLSSTIYWNSSLMGHIGDGASLTRSDLAAGTHTITASVIDSSGLTAKTTMTLTIGASAAYVPASPSSPAAAKSNGKAKVTWADNSNNETWFEVERQYKTGKNWANPVAASQVGANVTSTLDAPGSGVWRYRIRAVNSAGPSQWSVWSGSVRL